MGLSTMESKTLREQLLYKRFDNGLKVFFIPKEGYTKQYAIFATNYGSNDSKFKIPGTNQTLEVPDGIAHFLEHKLFEEPEGSIFDKFSQLGSNPNAYTNFTSTCYLFSCTDKFYENLELLIQFVQHPYFTDENVTKEKGIIEQEIRMYDDNPNWKVFFNALKAMYHQHPVKIDIAGTVESINRITKEDLYKCHEIFYTPSNMILLIVGDVEWEELLKVADKNIKGKITEVQGEIERLYPVEPNTVVQHYIENKLAVSIPLFNIAFKEKNNGLRGQDLLVKDISIKLILDMVFGKSSDLYNQLYEMGLINETFEHEYTGEIDYGYSMIGGESKNPQRVLEMVRNRIQELKGTGLNHEDFERIKRKQIGNHLSYFNSVEFIATTFIAYYFKDINLFDYIDTLKSITFETVEKQFYDHFDENMMVLSTILPK